MTSTDFSPARALAETSFDSAIIANSVNDARKNAGRLSEAINGFRVAQPQDELSRLRGVLNKAISSAINYEKECLHLRNQLEHERRLHTREVEALNRRLQSAKSQAEQREQDFVSSLEKQLNKERTTSLASVLATEKKLTSANRRLAELTETALESQGYRQTAQLFNSETQSYLLSALS